MHVRVRVKLGRIGGCVGGELGDAFTHIHTHTHTSSHPIELRLVGGRVEVGRWAGGVQEANPVASGT